MLAQYFRLEVCSPSGITKFCPFLDALCTILCAISKSLVLRFYRITYAPQVFTYLGDFLSLFMLCSILHIHVCSPSLRMHLSFFILR